MRPNRLKRAPFAVTLKLYNTLTGREEPFEPLDPQHVRMYVCGPTVYDRAHIGNARPVIVFDVLYRLLKRLYPRVTYVRNITDVDDKINAAAKERGVPIGELTRTTTQYFHDDIAELNTLKPGFEPRATEHIPQMIALVEKLLANGCAYAADGHVLFEVRRKNDYGKLSRQSRDEMIEGARVEVAPYKKDPLDFVLWKPSTPDLPGWESPWGRGRPGWHLECSAMSQHILGTTFDIHGGGADLVFPHHENEIAQSECAHRAPFVRYWVHNGFLTVEGEKMSKSLGNFITIREALNRLPGEVIRFNMLGSHYRKPADWTHAGEEGAKKIMNRIYRVLRDAAVDAEQAEELPHGVLKALLDDLNTVEALRQLRLLVDQLGEARTIERKRELKSSILASGEVLGLLKIDPVAWFRWQPRKTKNELDVSAIEVLVTARTTARQQRDFAEADRFRRELHDRYGVIVLDEVDGTTKWELEK